MGRVDVDDDGVLDLAEVLESFGGDGCVEDEIAGAGESGRRGAVVDEDGEVGAFGDDGRLGGGFPELEAAAGGEGALEEGVRGADDSDVDLARGLEQRPGAVVGGEVVVGVDGYLGDAVGVEAELEDGGVLRPGVDADGRGVDELAVDG